MTYQITNKPQNEHILCIYIPLITAERIKLQNILYVATSDFNYTLRIKLKNCISVTTHTKSMTSSSSQKFLINDIDESIDNIHLVKKDD